MKKRNKQIGMTVAVVALLVSVLPNVQADDKHYEGWVRSFAEAKELAAKEGKSILMEFTGSDWCRPCMNFHEKVLGTDHFKAEITKDFILLVLDSPQDKSLVTDAEQTQYKKLSAEYKVSAVPTVILTDAEGKPYHRQGYGGDPADKWVENARGKVKVLAQRDEFFAQASEAKGVERAKLLEEAISGIDEAVRLSYYADTVTEIVSLDADDTAGLKSKYEDLRQAEQFKAKLNAIQRTSRGKQPQEVIAAIDELIKTAKPTGAALQQVIFLKSTVLIGAGDKEGAEALLDELIKTAKPTGAALQEIIFFKSNLLFRSGDKDGAKALLLEAQKLAPNTATGKRIPQIIEQFFK